MLWPTGDQAIAIDWLLSLMRWVCGLNTLELTPRQTGTFGLYNLVYWLPRLW